VGDEWFSLSTLVLDEIVALRTVHSLPHRRNSGLLGLVNVRGELVICVSIAPLLIGRPTDEASRGRLVVARHGNQRLAFPVDEVQHNHHYFAGELQRVPTTVANSPSNLTHGLLSLDGRMVGCLDERLLFDALNRNLL
jgi:chemotaxis-related protein WspD